MKTPRRLPKPFTVEVRLASRQAAVRSITQQPDWPVLPAQPEKAEQRPPEPDPVPIATASAGRVLPALDDPAPAIALPKPSTRQPKPKPLKPAAQLAAEEPPEREATTAVKTEVTDVVDAASTPLPEPRRPRGYLPRLPRSAFPRGERWKARLPAICVPRSDRGTKG